MGTGRISTNFQSDQAISNMQRNLKLLTEIQNKIASGKNIMTSSDDPMGYATLSNITTSLDSDERYISNINAGKSETQMADTAMKNVTDLIQRAKELTTQAASDTMSQTNRNAIAAEIDSIMNQLVQVGNTQIAGKYIFGGLDTTNAPFARTGTTVTYAGTGTASNPNFTRSVEIAPNVTVGVNVSGLTVFGEASPNGAPPPAFNGSGLFQTLMTLQANLQAGDTTEIRSRLDDLSTDLTTVLGEQAKMGVAENQLDLTLNRIEDRKVTLTAQYNSIQNVDMAKAISDLNFQENIYQASLGVAGRLMQTSLLNYLR